MKKWFTLALTAALLVGVLCGSALADGGSELVQVLMSTPGVTVTPAVQGVDAADLDEAVENGQELIPEDCALTPGRITVLQSGSLECEEEVFDVTFKVWSTLKRTVGLLFLPEEGEAWELVTCNLGDVIEGRFEVCGTYAIVVGW